MRAGQARGVGFEPNSTRGKSATPPYLREVVSLSPRSTCRIDQHNQHRYTVADLPQQNPTTPWALHLTDRRKNFRLIAIDLDDHNEVQGADVAADLALLTALCDELDLPYLVCASGPSHGRHLWLHCEPVDRVIVDRLVWATKQLCRSFDASALSNPATGCVRAPGSMHRHGGRSIPRPHGDHPTGLHAIKALARNPVPSDRIAALADRLTGLAHATKARTHRSSRTPETAPSAAASSPPLAHDAGYSARPSRSFLNTSTDSGGTERGFPRRPLAPFAEHLMQRAPDRDASRASHTIARSFVYAGRGVDEFIHAALVDRMPGLEHIRTAAVDGGRVDRRDAHTHAQRQFARAEASIPAAHRGSPTGAPGAQEASREVVDTAHAALDVAWRGAGWTGPSGAILLRALAGLAQVTVARRRRIVTVSIRSWATRTGLTTDQIFRASNALEAAGWIECVHPASGPLAAQWRIVDRREQAERLQQFSVTASAHPPSLASVPSAAATLEGLTETGRSPVWELPGLGTTGHAIWWLLTQFSGCSPVQLQARLGLDSRTVKNTVLALQRFDLVRGCGHSELRALPLDRAARHAAAHGCEETVQARAHRYLVESALWAARCAERVWRTSRDRVGLPDHVRQLRRSVCVDGPVFRTESSFPRQRGVTVEVALIYARQWCRRLAAEPDLTAAERHLLGTHDSWRPPGDDAPDATRTVAAAA